MGDIDRGYDVKRFGESGRGEVGSRDILDQDVNLLKSEKSAGRGSVEFSIYRTLSGKSALNVALSHPSTSKELTHQNVNFERPIYSLLPSRFQYILQ